MTKKNNNNKRLLSILFCKFFFFLLNKLFKKKSNKKKFEKKNTHSFPKPSHISVSILQHFYYTVFYRFYIDERYQVLMDHLDLDHIIMSISIVKLKRDEIKRIRTFKQFFFVYPQIQLMPVTIVILKYLNIYFHQHLYLDGICVL